MLVLTFLSRTSLDKNWREEYLVLEEEPGVVEQQEELYQALRPLELQVEEESRMEEASEL